MINCKQIFENKLIFSKNFESFMNMVICTIDETSLCIYTKGAIKIEK